jgi:hypothetical protein
MWKVEQRAGILWRVVGPGGRVWGANKGCTEAEATFVADALNMLATLQAADSAKKEPIR